MSKRESKDVELVKVVRKDGKVRERTLANKNEAISFAVYRNLVDLFPLDKPSVFDPLMAILGYDPDNLTINTETPAGIGNVSCAAVLSFRHNGRP